MKTAVLALLASSAAAFSPASSSRSATQLNAAAELENMIGGKTIETGGKIFDPLNLSDWAPVDYLRKAEIANGRSAMLATVGWLFPSVFGTFDSQDVTTTDPIEAILQADPQWWAQFAIFCGVVEAYKFRNEQDGKSYTGVGGPPVIDYMGAYPSDPKKQEEMALKELKNGRLAMIGIAGFLSAHFIPGSVPGTPDWIVHP